MSKKTKAIDGDSEQIEIFKALKAHRREEIAAELPAKQDEIRALREAGYTVVERDEGRCFRINRKLDLYPVRKRWHFIPKNSRGWYDTARAIADRLVGKQ